MYTSGAAAREAGSRVAEARGYLVLASADIFISLPTSSESGDHCPRSTPAFSVGLHRGHSYLGHCPRCVGRQALRSHTFYGILRHHRRALSSSARRSSLQWFGCSTVRDFSRPQITRSRRPGVRWIDWILSSFASCGELCRDAIGVHGARGPADIVAQFDQLARRLPTFVGILQPAARHRPQNLLGPLAPRTFSTRFRSSCVHSGWMNYLSTKWQTGQ